MIRRHGHEREKGNGNGNNHGKQPPPPPHHHYTTTSNIDEALNDCAQGGQSSAPVTCLSDALWLPRRAARNGLAPTTAHHLHPPRSFHFPFPLVPSRKRASAGPRPGPRHICIFAPGIVRPIILLRLLLLSLVVYCTSCTSHLRVHLPICPSAHPHYLYHVPSIIPYQDPCIRI